MEQAAAGVQRVLTAEQQFSRWKALVTAKEAAYQQLAADPTIDLYGPRVQT